MVGLLLGELDSGRECWRMQRVKGERSKEKG